MNSLSDKLRIKSSGFLAVLITTIALGSVAPNRLMALEFQCELPGDIRYLKVDIPSGDKLCAVNVDYLYNGESKVLWHAQNDSTFCTERAYELRDKYVDTWQYTCTNWPDRDGIDQLSPSQRVILDRQLRAGMDRGKISENPYQVTAVKAVASTQQNQTQGLLAFQYFTDSDNDYTEIIVDEGDSWELITTLDNLITQVASDTPLNSALIHTITDDGALEIHTTVNDGPQHECYGSQVLSISQEGKISTKTPHQYVCHQATADRQNTQ